MAISKKSLGKVLAISMASAMAMSSLSAALVSVSAVQNPALASNGQVEFKVDAEDQVVALLGGVDNEVDTIVNNEFDLSGILNDSLYESKLQYTDADGLTADIDVTKITYRISSGGSYAKINKDNSGDSTLVAQKAGTATLQIKVTGDVELGGDKNNKEVTFTHNITLNVHADKEIGLKAYMGKSMLSSDDLNNLAAYNSDSITFKLVSFHKVADGKNTNFAAEINPNLQIGADNTTLPPEAETPQVEEIANAIGATEALKEAMEGSADKDGKVTAITQTAWDAITSNNEVLLTVTTGKQAVPVMNAYSEATKNDTNVAGNANKLYRTEIAEAVAPVMSRAGENKVTVYFAIDEAALPASLNGLVDKQPDKMYFKNGTLGDDTTGTAVFVWKVKGTLTTPVTLTKSDIGDLETMNKIITAANEELNTPDNPDKPSTSALDKATAAIKKVITDAAGDAELSATLDADIAAALTYDKDANTVTLTGWDTLKTKTAIQKKDAVAGKTGFVVTAEEFTNQKKAAENYDAATAKEDLAKVLGAASDTVEADTIYVTTDGVYFAKVSDTVKSDTSVGESTATVADLLNIDGGTTGKFYDKTDNKVYDANDNASSRETVTVYTLKDDVTSVERKAETPYDKDTWGKAVEDAMAEKKVETVKGDDGTNTYFITKTNADTASLAANGKVYDDEKNTNALFTLAATESTVGATPEVPAKTFDDLFYTGTTAVDGKESLDEIIKTANAATDPTPEKEIAVLSAVDLKTSKLKSVRFYAGSGAELFDLMAAADQPTASNKIGSGKWEKGTKSNNSKGFAVDATGEDAEMNLYTKGATGNATVKARVDLENGTFDEYVLNIRTVKAVDFGAKDVTVDKDGSKTIMSISPADPDYILGISDLEKKSLSGYELRTTGAVTVEDGTVGVIDADGDVTVHGGRTGNIIEAGRVTVDGGATVGDIVDATGDVSVTESSTAGTITTNIDKVKDEIVGMVTVNDATIAGIDANCSVEVKGGEINGSVVADGKIEITSVDEDEDGNLMDVVINGSVISKGKGTAQIIIDNEGDEGKANITIRGDVNARYANVDSDPSVQIGSSNTTGLISVSGAVQGEHIVLGGNGLVTLGAVRAVNEVEHSDEEGVVVDSKLEFQGFNSGINTISNFADVVVSEGTVNVVNPLTTTTLDIQSDTQIVLASMTVEDITGDGNIVVPAGELTVNGNVDDSPVLTLLGDVAVNTVAYHGNRGLTDKFDLGGLTVKAERQTNGVYDYIVSAQELYGVRTVGKNVTVGQGQTKSVTVVADAALPQGASIVWTSDDKEVATVEGNGTTATITGVDIGAVDVTATIVDANGRDLGYENATFNVEVLYADTSEVTGNGTGTDENELDLDTKKKNMEAGQVYTFMVRGNNDVENISVTSGDTNVATVALANGADSRGALYNITAVADGKTDITVTYQGKTSKIAVKVGGFQLDTSSKKMAPGQVYSVLAKNVPADQAGNVTLAYDNNIVDVVKVNDNYNGRGVLFNVTAKAIGETEVKVTHNGETETMAVNVVENTGRLTLDTASYTMPFGGNYTIGVKVEKNGRQLSGEEVRAMITSGELVVTDSRTGSIVTTEVQANGNVRVTGRQNEGTTYVQFIVMQNGQRVTHASVGVTVQNGATAGGSSVRSISQW